VTTHGKYHAFLEAISSKSWPTSQVMQKYNIIKFPNNSTIMLRHLRTRRRRRRRRRRRKCVT
jgi:hypothetical protein